MKKKIIFQVTFELEDMERFSASYPNFKYNYGTYEEWAKSCIEDMLGEISEIKGQKVSAIKISFSPVKTK